MRLLALAFAVWGSGVAAEITGATYITPSDAYGHGAVEGGEYDALRIETTTGAFRISSAGAVFEDVAPRLVDLDGDGSSEVVAVQSGFSSGARIVVYGMGQGAPVLRAANAPIGQRNRWLAIAGIADLDGDGRMEIAYVDRPHLAKILRVLEVVPDGEGFSLREEGTLEGVTNHRYRAPEIEGGLRACGGRPELILADADWKRIVAVSVEQGQLVPRIVGPYTGAASLERARSC